MGSVIGVTLERLISCDNSQLRHYGLGYALRVEAAKNQELVGRSSIHSYTVAQARITLPVTARADRYVDENERPPLKGQDGFRLKMAGLRS